MTGIDILEKTKGLLTEKGWIKKAIAKDIQGDTLSDPHDPRAVSYCLIGGLIAAAGHSDDKCPYIYAWRALQASGDIVAFNNASETTLEDVVRKIDEAIVYLKEQAT